VAALRRRGLRISAAVVCVVVAASAFVGPAEGGWSAQYAVTVAPVGNMSGVGLWAGQSGRVAVTWTMTGVGPPTMWLREYVPSDGWYAAVEVGRNTFVIPVVHAAAFGAGNVLYLAHDSADELPSMRVSQYAVDKGVSLSANLAQAPDFGVMGALMRTDAAGAITLAWASATDPDGGLYASRLEAVASVWSMADRLDDRSGRVSDFAAAVEAGGAVRVAWNSEKGNSSELWSRARAAGGGWAAAERLEESAQVHFEELAVAFEGLTAADAYVLWVERPVAGGESVMRASTVGATGNRTAPVNITAATVVIHVRAANAFTWPLDGETYGPFTTSATVVWAQTMGGGLVTCRATGDGAGGWSPPSALHEGAGASHEPLVETGAAPGRTAWVAVTSGGTQVWERSYSGSWGAPQLAGQGAGVQSENIGLAVDGRGVGWVVWSEVSSASSQIIVRAEGLPASEDISRLAAGTQSPPGLSGLVVPLAVVAVVLVAAVWVWRRRG
jgi:hypothetical protein